MKKSTSVEKMEAVIMGFATMIILALVAWTLFCPHTRHYYRVTVQSGKVYEVAEFSEPSRHCQYYQGIVNGKRYVFSDITSYARMEKTYQVKYL